MALASFIRVVGRPTAILADFAAGVSGAPGVNHIG